MAMSAIGKFVRLGCLAALLSPMSVAARPQTTGTFQIRASVPMACWVDHSVAVDALGMGQGQVTEGCNNASGYIVSAMYRPLGDSESARLVYGDSMVDLSAMGLQEVHREHGPRIQQIAYRFDDVALDAPLTLSLTIQPI